MMSPPSPIKSDILAVLVLTPMLDPKTWQDNRFLRKVSQEGRRFADLWSGGFNKLLFFSQMPGEGP